MKFALGVPLMHRGEDNAFLRHAPLVGIGARKAALLPNEEVTSYRV